MAGTDGWVAIGFKADTKELERDKTRIERQLKSFDEQIEDLTDIKIRAELDQKSFGDTERQLKEVDKEIEELQTRLGQIKSLKGPKFNLSETSTYKELREAQEKQKKLEEKVKDEAKARQKNLSIIEKTSSKISEIERKQDRQKAKLSDINKQLDKAPKESEGGEGGGLLATLFGGTFGKIVGVVSLIGFGISSIIDKVGKWGMAMLGIRSAYSFIRQSVSTIASYNDRVKDDVAYIRFALASTLEPLIKTLVDWALKFLAVIGAVIKTLTGYNIFSNATLKNFQKSQGALDKTNKSAKELRKTLASFDELNVIQDQDSSSGGGGASIPMPSIDLSTTDLFKNWNLDNLIEKGKEIALKVAQGINDFFTKTNWSELGKKISDFIIGAIDVAILFFDTVDWDKIGRSIGQFLMSIDWGTIFSKLADLILGKVIPGALSVLNGVLDEILKWLADPKNEDKLTEGLGKIIEAVFKGLALIGTLAWEAGAKLWAMLLMGLFGIGKPTGGSGGGTSIEDTSEAEKKGEKLGTSIVGGLGEGIKSKIPSLFSIIKGLWDGIDENSNTGLGKLKKSLKEGKLPEWIKQNIIDKISEKVSSFANSVGSVITSLLKNAINKTIELIEKRVNSGIKIINKLISLLQKLPGVGGAFSTVSEVKLPRLAKGGIINQPGSGVMVGSAIVGEQAPEGVIPLTDSQQMELLGEAIGRHVVINASVTNTMNGRVISREIQRINNESDFAYNAW